MSSAKVKRLYVFSYAEILGIFLSFVAVLFLLYPEQRLEKQILKESSNYDLTVLYLENMVKHDPQNEDLLLAFAQALERSGNVDLSIQLLKTLKDVNNPVLKKEMFSLKYFILKNQLNNYSGEVKKEKYNEIQTLLNKITKNDYSDLKDIKQWYDEAIWIKNYELAYKLAEEALRKSKNNIYWLKQKYYLAIKVGKQDEAYKLLDTLVKLDAEHKEIWLKEDYYRASNNKEYHKAEKILISLEKISSIWKVKRASLYIDMKEYSQASELYMEIYKDSSDYDIKKRWFIKAIESLQYGNLMSELVELCQKHEDEYIDDTEMRERFLKIYLAANNLDAAVSISNKLLKKDEEK